MPNIKNAMEAPFVYHMPTSGGVGFTTVTIPAGAVRPLNIDLKALDDDPALKAMFDNGSLREATDEDMKPEPVPADKLAKAEARLREAQAEVTRLQGMLRNAELDVDRRTPPHQFAGDGGPQQSPTVDGQGGAKTPQQEKDGRREPPRHEVDAAHAQRQAHAAKAAADERAKQQPQAPAKR